VKIDGLVNVYESEVTSGFYEGKHEAEGEFPGDRRLNEAFMKSAEDIWSMVEGYLNNNDYVPKSLYENFLGHQVNRIWQNTTSGSLSGTCWKKQRNILLLCLFHIIHTTTPTTLNLVYRNLFT